MAKNPGKKYMHAAHIKPNTHGTSNEISFSVLHATRLAMDDKKQNRKKNTGMQTAPLGKIKLFSLGGARKPKGTPKRHNALPLSGGAVSSSGTSGTPSVIGEELFSTPVVGSSSADGDKGLQKATASAAARLPHLVPPSNAASPLSNDRAASGVGSLGSASASASASTLASASTSTSTGIFSPSLPALPAGSGSDSRSSAGSGSDSRSSAGASASTTSTAARPKAASLGNPEAEIARRKAIRRGYRYIGIAMVVLICVGLIGAAGVAVYGFMQSQDSQSGSLKSALTELTKADDVVVKMDQIINDPMTSENQEQIPEVLKSVSEAKTLLNSSLTRTKAVVDNLVDNKDKEAAGQAIVAAEQRLIMLDEGTKILRASQTAANVVIPAQEAWDELLAADMLAREAATFASAATPESIAASRDKNAEALQKLRDVRSKYQNIAASKEVFDTQPYLDYVDLRIEALEHALASDEAFLIEDTETATAETVAYNLADAKAASAAGAFSIDPIEPIIERFEADTEAYRTVYDNARLKVTSADAFLRNYLGIQVK